MTWIKRENLCRQSTAFCACRWFILIIHTTYPFWKNYMIFTCRCAWWKVDHVLYPLVLWACKLKTIKPTHVKRGNGICKHLRTSTSPSTFTELWHPRVRVHLKYKLDSCIHRIGWGTQSGRVRPSVRFHFSSPLCSKVVVYGHRLAPHNQWSIKTALH